MLETEFQDKVMKKLRTLPFSHWEKMNDKVSIGVLDIYGTIRGRFVVLELKTTSKLSRRQLSNLQKYERAKAFTFAVDPKNWNEVFRYLALITASLHQFHEMPERYPARLLPAKRKTRERNAPGYTRKERF